MSVPISVLLPVFNAQRYLTAALESVFAQRFGDFEVIAVDDGSEDRSGEILREYAGRERRLRVISRPNTGIVGALNDAMAEAGGEFLARMDADDIALPERLGKQLDYLRGHPDCVLAGSRVLVIDPRGRPVAEMLSSPEGHEAIVEELLNKGWPLVHPSVMMRAETVRGIGGYRQGYAPNEDHDLFLRLAERGRLANVQEVLLKYRRHPASVCAVDSEVQRRKLDEVVNEHRRRRGMAALPPLAGEKQQTVVEVDRKWGWMALRAGNVATARAYAWGSVMRQPWNLEAWRLVYCAMRGR